MLAVNLMDPVAIQDDDDGQLTEAELSREVCLKLCETDTMWILDMPSIAVMNDSDEALDIVTRSSRYQQVTGSHLSQSVGLRQ